MRAVNLLPEGTRQASGPRGLSLGQLGPVHVVLGVLVVLLAYVTVYVFTTNTISDRKSQLASLNAKLSQEQAQVARLSTYTQFQKLAQARAETVRQIAASRFDWHGALSDLSKVMPATASLQSLLATVAPGASVSGAGGSTTSAGGGSLRGAISAPAFELKGCARSQDDVARLVSRMRLINDVQRVTLEDSTKADSAAAGAPASSAGSGGCSSGPSFDAVVFFQALPGAAATGTGSPSGAPVTTPAGASSRATSASTSSASTGASK